MSVIRLATDTIPKDQEENMPIVKLTIGDIYCFGSLLWAGWTKGDTEVRKGDENWFEYLDGERRHENWFDYTKERYFTGRYLGPDENGIEPLYRVYTIAKLIDNSTRKVLRWATVEELARSSDAKSIGPDGCIQVEGRRCYVDEYFTF